MNSKDLRLQLSEGQRREYLSVAEGFADEARNVIAKVTGTKLAIEKKADKSLVTQADIEIEQILRKKVEKLFPQHGVIGEEFGESNPKAEFQWIFDPVDGTDEFIHGVPTFGTVIALHYCGAPVIGVIDHAALSLRVCGGFGLGVSTNGAPNAMLSDGSDISPEDARTIVSKPKNFLYIGNEMPAFNEITKTHPRLRIFDSCYAYTNTITGGTDLMFDWNCSIWDFSPCQVLIEELGGRFISVARRSPAEGEKIRYCSLFGKSALVEQSMHLLPDRFGGLS